MASFRIHWKESVRKDFRRISPEQIKRIIQKVEGLIENPMPQGVKKLKDTEHTYRLRIGEYRIIYQIIVSDKQITICRVRHRKDVYKV